MTARGGVDTMAFPGTARVEQVMGLPVSVDVRTALPARELSPVLDDAFAWLRWVDRTFDVADGGAADLTERASGDHTSELTEVLERCAEMRDATGGYFDDPAVYVRGWAVERISRALSVAGAVDHCVNVGTAVRVRGSARPGAHWRIGIRDPRDEQVCKVLFAHDLAVATAHEGARRSVTVVGPDLGAACGYAAALRAMPPMPARRFAERLGAAGPYDVLLVERDGRTTGTPGLMEYGAAAGTAMAG
ncbi:FAD:protein FMN transferase [Spongiactinospora sp. TRM90649]|uniref:FAD:protein FMN transferase n=1 Tax=Spongiactinospora sp. TRM90649 TaxID=3031114 RepID=UPI0023F9F2E7|nr:FAD:protein FMN transferase [Spongiactinospora sp. TRM90649]MDF5753269.1 FAD:protein FMN transferase [Spongiactinospora sp. TRM90649]